MWELTKWATAVLLPQTYRDISISDFGNVHKFAMFFTRPWAHFDNFKIDWFRSEFKFWLQVTHTRAMRGVLPSICIYKYILNPGERQRNIKIPKYSTYISHPKFLVDSFTQGSCSFCSNITLFQTCERRARLQRDIHLHISFLKGTEIPPQSPPSEVNCLKNEPSSRQLWFCTTPRSRRMTIQNY